MKMKAEFIGAMLEDNDDIISLSFGFGQSKYLIFCIDAERPISVYMERDDQKFAANVAPNELKTSLEREYFIIELTETAAKELKWEKNIIIDFITDDENFKEIQEAFDIIFK